MTRDNSIVTTKEAVITGLAGAVFGSPLGVLPSIGLWYWLTKRNTPRSQKKAIWFIGGVAWLLVLGQISQALPNSPVATQPAKQTVSAPAKQFDTDLLQTTDNTIVAGSQYNLLESYNAATAGDDQTLSSLQKQGHVMALKRGIKVRRIQKVTTGRLGISEIRIVSAPGLELESGFASGVPLYTFDLFLAPL